MTNSNVFFPYRDDAKNPQFITCDNTQNHIGSCVCSTRNLRAASTHACLFLSVSCFGTRLVLTFNALYGSAGNLHTVFIYQQIPNFTNHEPLVAFRIASTACLVSLIEARLVDQFLHHREGFPASPRRILCTIECTVCLGITFTLYTFCSYLCMTDVERFSAVRKSITVCTSHSLDTFKGKFHVYLKPRKLLRTLVRKLHRVQEPIREHDVHVISTYKQWVCEQFITNHLH